MEPEMKAMLRRMAEVLHDAGDGCSFCVDHTIRILNKITRDYGYVFRMMLNSSGEPEDFRIVLDEKGPKE